MNRDTERAAGARVSNPTPNPGSPEARELDCQCPVMDNHYGRGSGYKNEDGTAAFWISDLCPIHGDLIAPEGAAAMEGTHDH